MTEMITSLNLVLLGKTGAGKSLTGNTILGRPAFISKKGSRSVTRDFTVESGSFHELPVNVYDTPGVSDMDMSEEEIQQMINEKVLQKCESDLCVFLLVIKADRFTEDERKTVEKIEKILGQNSLKNTWILFTRGDELEEENMTIQELIDDNEELKTLVQKYDHRYHVFNNKKKGPSEQVNMLFAKILKPYLNIMARGETLESNSLKRKIPENVEADTGVSSLPSRRIVLVGKSGVGKSAAGNTILRQREFSSVMSSNSVTSVCSEAKATISGRSVSVVDTPGLFDTNMNLEELMKEIAKSIYISSPGPHAFLIVFPVNMRFTEQEQQIPQLIEIMFGQDVLKYSIILFTHGDQLEGTTVEKLIEENSRLRDLVQQCGGRYQLFNNRDLNNREQVNDLLQKIDSMIQKNGGGHYTNQIYEDAQRLRQEEKEENLEGDSDGLKQFFYKHRYYFYAAAAIVLGAIIGRVVAVNIGGAIVKSVSIGAVAGGSLVRVVPASALHKASAGGRASVAGVVAVGGTAVAGAAVVGEATGGGVAVAVAAAIGGADSGGAISAAFAAKARI